MQTYSNPSRASDPHALPDVEVFYGWLCECEDGCSGYDIHTSPPALALATCSHCSAEYGFVEVGYFWQSCFPGCLPDSEPIGPFATESEAIANAQECAE